MNLNKSTLIHILQIIFIYTHLDSYRPYLQALNLWKLIEVSWFLQVRDAEKMLFTLGWSDAQKINVWKISLTCIKKKHLKCIYVYLYLYMYTSNECHVLIANLCCIQLRYVLYSMFFIVRGLPHDSQWCRRHMFNPSRWNSIIQIIPVEYIQPEDVNMSNYYEC